MDRIDLFITVPQIKYDKLVSLDQGTSSDSVRQRVVKARGIQTKRFGKDKSNSEIKINEIKTYCSVGSDSSSLLRKYVDSGKLSARGYHRVLRVARTIADLDNSENIKFNHVSEALMYRVNEIA